MVSGKAIDAHNALVEYAEFLRDVAGYPPEKVCEEIRRTAQEVVAQFAQKTKRNSCPDCHSKDIEPSFGSEGYIQCNSCGKEWCDA